MTADAGIEPPAPLHGMFVTGTGTGVGKTVVAASICAALAGAGRTVAAFKPVVTGLDEPDAEWPMDHELLAATANAGQAAEDVAPYRFGPPVSPHLAAELAGVQIEPLELAARARELAQKADVLVCEGVGGLLVPITTGFLVRDLAVELDMPLVVAADPALGTINHTLLTVEAARAGGLDVAAIVLTPWPGDPGDVERSNRQTIAALTGVDVHTLPRTSPDALARSSQALSEMLAPWTTGD